LFFEALYKAHHALNTLQAAGRNEGQIGENNTVPSFMLGRHWPFGQLGFYECHQEMGY
jgi:hypothetical protein